MPSLGRERKSIRMMFRRRAIPDSFHPHTWGGIAYTRGDMARGAGAIEKRKNGDGA
jgi:hypothetical protein